MCLVHCRFHTSTFVLFLGDVLSFALALWLSLFLRALEPPDLQNFLRHLLPFSVLFVIWTATFVIAGLYERQSVIFGAQALSGSLLAAQTVNIVLSAVFFFFIPFFGVAPKTILVLYLFTSFVLVLLWRVVIFPWLGIQKTENALVVGSGSEVDELVMALSRAPRAPIRVSSVIDMAGDTAAHQIKRVIVDQGTRFVICDFSDPLISKAFAELYPYISAGIRFLDAHAVYEQILGRVPLSQIDNAWLARNVSRTIHRMYDPAKRAMDIVGGSVAAVLSLPLYPFIVAAIKIEDGGPAVIHQYRVGQDNRMVRINKFRSMTGNDNGNYGAEGASQLRVTRVGRHLRRWRLDELPQLWKVIKGDMSLVGPRLELPQLVGQYEEQIPFYGVRHLVKPGLFGWAQLNYHGDAHHATDVESTKMKLAYDLYYIKHRSLTLDVLIAVQTVRRLLVSNHA